MRADDRGGGGHYGPVSGGGGGGGRGGGGGGPPCPTVLPEDGNLRGRGRPGGAAHLARIHGTEEDKVNCPFYFKIGACRHADRCSRLHHRPAFSPTILIKHIYRHPEREAELRASMASDPSHGGGDVTTSIAVKVDPKRALEDFLKFFENMYEELGKFGRIEALHVCDNLGDHMIGHVYAKFSDEEEAADAIQIMNGRYYDGRKMQVEYSPVTDFREARCRDFDEDTCSRGGFCNFMHIKPVPMCLIVSLEEDCDHERRRETLKRQERLHREKQRKRRSRGSSSKSAGRDNGRRNSSNRDSDISDSDDDSDDNSDRDDYENERNRQKKSLSRSRSRSRDRWRRGGSGGGPGSSGRGRSPSSSRSRSPSRSRGDKAGQRKGSGRRNEGGSRDNNNSSSSRVKKESKD